MGYALLFTGQGAQHPGMLPWLQRDDAVAAMEHHLGDDWRDRLADPAWAGNNAHAQVLLTGLALAAFHQLTTELGPPAVVAGYSVGELAAFAAAGVFDTTTALHLAVQRAACMDAAGARCATGLMAVSGHAPDGLQPLCQAFDLEVAIRIGPDRAVLGGPLQALAAAGPMAQALGLQVTPLNVALASHTRWMRPAAQAFGAVLRGAPLRAPHTPLVSAVRGRVLTADQAGEALERQIEQTVRWDECLERVAAQRVDAVLEIGPQQALAQMWNERWPGVPARSADEFRSCAAAVAWVRKQQAR
jgi:[acyl-carrier-protein] S-malonyltransferase